MSPAREGDPCPLCGKGTIVEANGLLVCSESLKGGCVRVRTVRALLIGLQERTAIARLIAHAETHPVSRARLAATMELDAPPIGNDPAHVVEVPMGYRCAFSFEDQPAGRCRHLSVSVDAPKRLPSVPAVLALMAVFGFTATAFEDLRGRM